MSNTQRPIFSAGICLGCLKRDDQITRQGAAISDLIDKCDAALYARDALLEVIAEYEREFGALVPEGAVISTDERPDNASPGHD